MHSCFCLTRRTIIAICCEKFASPRPATHRRCGLTWASAECYPYFCRIPGGNPLPPLLVILARWDRGGALQDGLGPRSTWRMLEG